MASARAISGFQRSCASPFGLKKYEYPPVFKSFLVHLVKSLNTDDRAAFKLWCLGVVPGSKRDRNMATDADVFNLIELLLCANELSFTNMSLLKAFLTTIGRLDLLQELQKAELRISIGIILEDYLKFKSVDGIHRGNDIKLPRDCHANIAEFLLTMKEENQELTKLDLGQLRQISDDIILEILNGSVLCSSQLSWSVVTASLVIIGELYATFSASSGGVDVATDGYYMSSFSETEISEVLAAWLIKHGGLVSKLNVETTYTYAKNNPLKHILSYY